MGELEEGGTLESGHLEATNIWIPARCLLQPLMCAAHFTEGKAEAPTVKGPTSWPMGWSGRTPSGLTPGPASHTCWRWQSSVSSC